MPLKKLPWNQSLEVAQLSFSYKDLGLTQSLHGNVYKVMNYEGQVTDVCHALQIKLA